MKTLYDCKDEIHSCSKCGLCQSVCPVYKVTGNDCTVSRGHFIMLRGLIKGELKMSDTINKYLDLCLKCNACSKFCPSGIDVVDIVTLAKSEYFKRHKREKFKSFCLKTILNGIDLLKHINIFSAKSKTFEKKVIYFSGCGGINPKTTDSIIKIFNSMNIEVIIPEFSCCGFPLFIKGDIDSFKEYADKFYNICKNYGEYDIVTNCATCEKTLKSYSKWFDYKNINVKNVFEYIKDNNIPLEIKNTQKVTFHKPCNMENYDDVKYILKNTKNLEYIEMNDYDKCCGFDGITNIKEHKIMSKIFKEKHENIKNTNAKTVLTSCLACKAALSLFSKNKYKVFDTIDFLAKNIK